jgi:Thioredoxin like C-terminal domain/AhpC/TSA family
MSVEGKLPSFDGANAWLNSEPLTPAGLRGKVVLTEFSTFSCVNWLRTLPYVRAWAEKYREHGLVVICAHTPEFEFEHDVEKIRPALEAMGVGFPVAVDNDYAVWRAFDNNYWPALYFADAQGRIRHHHFGEEDYERSERVIQQLLTDAGREGFDHELVSLEPDGVELAADWDTLGSPETYVGHQRASGFASPGGLVPDRSHFYEGPPKLDLNQWSLSGEWTVGDQPTELNEAGGRITHRFHARDVNLVMGAEGGDGSVAFEVRIDGDPPGDAHGLDVDPEGKGTVAEERLYQLVRQAGSDSDRTFEITFQGPGVRAYVFTFG